ncbi:MAG: DUF5119 domain-containing protein [Bacteroidales bacterium]|nr:DUF5119 domain-containing protein [Bacteroidales bacterium]MDD4529252.1 DUF5119 domain-containing protein [Bacteroidales bacterium]MDD4830094.1 DUF5119 domain-containing protein [Bacteroidales bacterium]
MKHYLRIFQNKKIYIIISLVLSIMFATSCERRDIFELPTAKVHIKINWSLEKQKTEFFYVVVYPIDKSKPIIRDFIESDGGVVAIPQGKYDILIYSFNYEKIVVNPSNSLLNSVATTNDINQYFAGMLKSISTRVLNETDEIFYISKYESLEIDDIEKDFYIEMTPKNIIKKYEIRIMVDNPSSIYSAFATISGFSGSYLLGQQRTMNDNVSLLSDVIIIDDKIVIPFCTFGLIPFEENNLNLRIKLINDSILEEQINITNQIQPMPNGGLIIIDTLLKIPIVTSSGIGATVGGWTDEEGVDIIL